MTLKKASALLLLAATALLFIRIGNFEATWIPKPFEPLLALAAILAVFHFIKHHQDFKDFYYRIPRSILIASLIILLAPLLGLFITHLRGIPLVAEQALEYLRLVMALTTFALFFYHAESAAFIKRAYFALIVPVVCGVFIILPRAFLLQTAILASDDRLTGLTNNPSTFSKIIMVGLILLFAIFIFEKNLKYRVLPAIGLTTLSALSFWTDSRQGLIGTALGIITILFLIWYKLPWRRIMYSVLIIACLAMIGTALVPTRAKNATLSRIFNTPIVSGVNEVLSPVADTRISSIWPYFLYRVYVLPLGEGPGYYTHDFVRVGANRDIAGAHNSTLEAGLIGGWPTLIAFIYLLFSGIQRSIAAAKKTSTYITVGLCAVLVGLIFAIQFDDSLKFYWTWIILGLILGQEAARTDQRPASN